MWVIVDDTNAVPMFYWKTVNGIFVLGTVEMTKTPLFKTKKAANEILGFVKSQDHNWNFRVAELTIK